MRYIARFGQSGEEQELVNHLTGVSKKIRGLADNDVFGEIAGILHDIGKYSVAFQEHLKTNSEENIDHSSAGAQWKARPTFHRARRRSGWARPRSDEPSA